MGFCVANKYKKAKDLFCTSGADSKTAGSLLRLGGMANSHMPATYYFIALDTLEKLTEAHHEIS